VSPARRSPPRLGVFGGTFDPIHLGHLRCAEEAREQLGLTRIVFIPAADPPHKSRRMTPPAQRLAMVRLAIAGNPAFAASNLELRRAGPSYSIDTLRALHAGEPHTSLTCSVSPTWRYGRDRVRTSVRRARSSPLPLGGTSATARLVVSSSTTRGIGFAS
jgi:nicotinate (nicotinamide) nucleotide adenylyltransferase